MSRFLATIALLASATNVLAQTETHCDGRKATCPPNPALGTTFKTEFNASMSEFDPRFFNVTAGSKLVSFTDDGADMTISSQGESVTVMTAFYIFFGRAEMIFKAAPGQGVISTMITLSDTLDEIDWEIKGGNTSFISNNYFGWGNLEQNFGEEPSTEDWEGGAMGGFHNYTFDWNEERIEYIMDDKVVRTVEYQEPGIYPQTPSFVRFGIWAAGDPDLPEGTREWAGGDTDFDQGPFTMTVKSLKVIDAHSNSSWYSYGDKSGHYESIKIEEGESNAYKEMHKKSSYEKAEKQWEGLSTGAKVGIAGGVVGFVALCFIGFLFYCFKQRRAGKAEAAAADKEWNGHQAELAEYSSRMKRGDFALRNMGHGEKF